MAVSTSGSRAGSAASGKDGWRSLAASPTRSAALLHLAEDGGAPLQHRQAHLTLAMLHEDMWQGQLCGQC